MHIIYHGLSMVLKNLKKQFVILKGVTREDECKCVTDAIKLIVYKVIVWTKLRQRDLIPPLPFI